MNVLTTYKILKAKAFDELFDESLIDWAIEMMEAGYESDNLYMLAGNTKPYNQFELQDLTTKVLQDLHLDYSNQEIVLDNYIYSLLSNSVNRPETYLKTLGELQSLCQLRNMDTKLLDFYLLYFAKDDLVADDVQFYWPDANRQNIDQIIHQHFENWITEFKDKQSREL